MSIRSYWVVKYKVDGSEKVEELDVDLETESFDEIIGHAEDEICSESDDLISPKDIKVIQITDGNIDPYVFKN